MSKHAEASGADQTIDMLNAAISRTKQTLEYDQILGQTSSSSLNVYSMAFR